MSYQDVFDGRTPVVIDEIEYTGSEIAYPETIEFDSYDNPDIDISVSGRFATHEIIGGITVRQKIGRDPVEISVNGVCSEDTAKQIDTLRRATTARFISERKTMVVQIASASSQPLEKGGAADLDTGDYLYSYNLNLIGIETPGFAGGTPTIDEIQNEGGPSSGDPNI